MSAKKYLVFSCSVSLGALSSHEWTDNEKVIDLRGERIGTWCGVNQRSFKSGIWKRLVLWWWVALGSNADEIIINKVQYTETWANRARSWNGYQEIHPELICLSILIDSCCKTLNYICNLNIKVLIQWWTLAKLTILTKFHLLYWLFVVISEIKIYLIVIIITLQIYFLPLIEYLMNSKPL